MGLDAQQQHDRLMARRAKKGLNLEGSKQRLKTALREKQAFDPIAAAMQDHPGLTRDEAERHARALGF